MSKKGKIVEIDPKLVIKRCKMFHLMFRDDIKSQPDASCFFGKLNGINQTSDELSDIRKISTKNGHINKMSQDVSEKLRNRLRVIKEKNARDITDHIEYSASIRLQDRSNIKDEDLVLRTVDNKGYLSRGFISKVKSHNFEMTVFPDVTSRDRTLHDKLIKLRQFMIELKSKLVEYKHNVDNGYYSDIEEYTRSLVFDIFDLTKAHRIDKRFVKRLTTTLPYVATLIKSKSNKKLPEIFPDEITIGSSKTYRTISKSDKNSPYVFIPEFGDIPVYDMFFSEGSNSFYTLFGFMKKQSSVTICITTIGELAFRVKGSLASLDDVLPKIVNDNAKINTNLTLVTENMNMCDRYVIFKCNLTETTQRFFESLLALDKLRSVTDKDQQEIISTFRASEPDTHDETINVLSDLCSSNKLTKDDIDLILEGLSSTNNWYAVCKSYKDKYRSQWLKALSGDNKGCDDVLVTLFTPTMMGKMNKPRGNEQMFEFNFRGCSDHVMCSRQQNVQVRFAPKDRLKYNVITLKKSNNSSVFSSSFETYIVVTN